MKLKNLLVILTLVSVWCHLGFSRENNLPQLKRFSEVGYSCYQNSFQALKSAVNKIDYKSKEWCNAMGGAPNT